MHVADDVVEREDNSNHLNGDQRRVRAASDLAFEFGWTDADAASPTTGWT